MGNNINVDKNKIVLEVKNLTKHFTSGTGKNKLVVPAVDGVSFDVYKKEVFGLVGESGCGKTTTGRTIIKLYGATEGHVKLNGNVISIGYKGILKQIKEVKLEANNRILEIDKHAAAIHEIDEKLASDIIDIEYNKKNAQKAFDKKAEETQQPLDDYRDSQYQAKNSYDLAVAKVVHEYNIAVTKVKNSTENSVKADYERDETIETFPSSISK